MHVVKNKKTKQQQQNKIKLYERFSVALDYAETIGNIYSFMHIENEHNLKWKNDIQVRAILFFYFSGLALRAPMEKPCYI